MNNSVNAVFKRGRNFSVEANGHTIEIDTKKESGGDDIGPSPKIFMLLSLAGCTGFDIVSILEKMRVSFSDLSISVDGHLTDSQPAIYDQVTIHYSIKLNNDDRPKMEKAVKLSEEKYCGVSRMFKSFAKVDFKIHYL
ncbi:MAG: OsmC family protein [Chitinophagaceae bacterium]|nr:OsmC family protein [Chitinophagaceae bacterium]